MGNNADVAVSEAAAEAAAHRLAARLARLDLDAETLELVMAVLTTDVCDHFDDTAPQFD